MKSRVQNSISAGSRTTRSRAALLASSVLGLALVSGVAQAQESGAAMLEEVIVTAQKRAENIQDVAAAITPVNTDNLIQRGGSNLTAVQGTVPSVEINSSNAATGVAIRGIFSTNDGPQGDPAVAFHVDGVYLGRPQSAGMLFYDLDRVEVLRGPQGTLYGRNATAGAVNVLTARPKFDFDAQMGAEAGNYNLFGVNGMLNVPFSDTLAARVAFRTVKRDGYAADEITDDQDQQGVRGSLLWQPSDDLSLNLRAYYDQRVGVGSAAYRLAVPSRDPRSTNIVNPGAHIDNRNYGLQAELNWDFGFAALTVLPAVHRFDLDYLYASDRPISILQEADQQSLEVRLASPADQRLNWIIGAFYWNEVQSSYQSLLNPVSSPPLARPNFFYPHIEGTSSALFGQATFGITDTLRVTGGLRYTMDNKNQRGEVVVMNPVGVVVSRIPSVADNDWDAVNWKLSVEYDIAPQSMLYATAATGYKAGGTFDGLAPNSYDPEELLSFEIGSKNRFFNNALQLNIDVFHYRYEGYHASQVACLNLPVGAPPCSAGGGTGRVTYNAEEASVTGVEVEGQWAITSNDRLNFTVAYLDGKFDKFVLPRTVVSAGGVYSGNPLPKSPDWTVSGEYSHRFDLANGGDVTASVRGRYVGDQYLLFDIARPEVKQEAYTMADLALVYTAPEEKFVLSAYVNNVSDELIKSYAFFSATGGFFNGNYQPPRTYGVKLDVNF